MESNEDNLSNCMLKSSDMQSIDSNPRSDLDFADFNTDVKDSEPTSIISLPKLQKKTPRNDNSATRLFSTTNIQKGHLRKINRNNSV